MSESSVMVKQSGYRVNGGHVSIRVRTMTLDEVKALRPGQRVMFLDNNGRVRGLTINGRPRTWKRDPSRVEVPVKYGLYEYGTFTGPELARLVAEVGGAAQ